MHEGSPPADEKGAARSLVVVALVGLVLLVGVAGFAWFMLRARSDVPRSEPRSVESAPAAQPESRATTTQEEVDLEARVRSEIARRRNPVSVRVRARDPDGTSIETFHASASLPASSPDELRSPPITVSLATAGVCELPGVTGLTPELAEIRVSADGFAEWVGHRVVLPGRDVELETVRLSRGVELRGRISKGSGRPSDLHVVSANPVGTVDRTESLPSAGRKRFVKADSEGQFRLEHVGLPRVRLTVTGGDGWANAVLPDVDVLAGPVTVELEPSARISGIVVDANGSGVSATVTAAMAGPQERSFGSVVTDKAGKFQIVDLANGYYTLRIEAKDFADAVVPRAHTDVAGLTIVLHALATASLELHGTPDGIDVPVIWKPIAVAGATRRPAAPPSLAWMRDRKLVIHGIPAGTHALELAVPGAMPVVTPAVEFALDAVTELGSFTLAAGATLRTSVRSPDGKPLAARVALAAPHHTAIAMDRDVFALPDRLENACNGDGSLEWIALPPGERVFTFRAEGFSDRNVRVSIPESGTLTLDPVTLAPAGSISGDLRTHAGRPLGAIEITARRIGGPTFSTTTALDGYYEFLRLEPGRYELTVLSVDSGIPADLESALTPKENVTRLVDLVPTETKRCDLTIESD